MSHRTTHNVVLFMFVIPFIFRGCETIKMEAEGAKRYVVWGQQRMGAAGPEIPLRCREVLQKDGVRDSPCPHVCLVLKQAGLRAS